MMRRSEPMVVAGCDDYSLPMRQLIGRRLFELDVG